MRKKVKGFLFDMDGTLIDSTPIIENTWRLFSDEHNLDSQSVIKYAQGRRTEATVFHFLGESEATKKITKEIEAYEEVTTEGIVAMPGAKEMLSQISPDDYAVVTSANRTLCINRITAAGLPLPQTIISAESVAKGKPEPDGYLLGAQKLGITTAEAIVFEDAQAGMIAALRSGASLIVIGDCEYVSDEELARSKDFTRFTVSKHDDGYQISWNDHEE